MYLPDFDYHTPTTLEDACSLLVTLGPEAKLLAGGTDLLHKMKDGDFTPSALISLRKIDALRGIRYEPGRGVVIGAMSTQNDLYRSSLLHERYCSISDAAHQMASNQIRNSGTVGGNIVNGVPSADLPPILIALSATIELVSPQGARSMELESFFVEPASTVIAPDEVLTEIVIPDQATNGSNYQKFGLRRSGALAVCGAAAAVTLDDGVFRSARIVLASSAPVVMRATDAETFLVGKEPNAQILEEAAQLAATQSRPRDSIRGSAEYRRNLAGVLTKRALRQSIDNGHDAPGGAGD